MNPLKARYLQLAALLPGGTSDHPVTSPPSLVELAPFLKLASQQRMIPALGHPRAAAALNLPPEVAEDLARILELNTRRNQDLKAQTIDAVEALNCEGIDPLVLKGAAALLDDHYKIPGGVVIADVDMVVPEKELARCYQVLQRSGFVQTAPIRWDRHHLPPLLHEKTSTTLELHRWLAKRGVQDLLPASACWDRAQLRIASPSGRYRLLHPTDALVHNIVHAQLHHAAYLCRSVRMKNLYDFALIASRSGSLIDWESIQHAARAPLYPRAARWHMALARELFPWSGIPAMDSSDPFARLRSGMSPRRELSYKRNMNRLNTLLFEPRFVSGRLLRKLFSPFSLPQTLHEASGAARNVFSRWSRQS